MLLVAMGESRMSLGRIDMRSSHAKSVTDSTPVFDPECCCPCLCYSIVESSYLFRAEFQTLLLIKSSHCSDLS